MAKAKTGTNSSVKSGDSKVKRPYVHSKSKAACLICRKEHIPPETVQEQDNTYHDIVITINQQNLEHVSVQPTYLKAIYAIGTCILLSIIIVIFIWTWS